MTEVRVVTAPGVDIGIDKLIRDWLTETAFDIEVGAKRGCPVDTGRLRASITTKPGRREVIIGTDVEYAEAVHEGTAARVSRSRKGRGGIVGRIIPARRGRPFLATAFDDTLNKAGNPLRL